MKDDQTTEIENIFDEEFHDDSLKAKGESPAHKLLSPKTNIVSDPMKSESFSDAMKTQYWSNIFDPTHSQFDVIIPVKR